MLTQQQLKEHYDYDPLTGLFRYRKTHRRVTAGDIAGNVKECGHRKMSVLGKYYYAHRLVFLYMTGVMPTLEIDHKDHDPDNNAWDNLREVDHPTNGKNQKKFVSNTSGHTGVHLKSTGKYRARICVNNKHIHLGNHDTFELAVAARKAAEIQYGFHENHGQ